MKRRRRHASRYTLTPYIARQEKSWRTTLLCRLFIRFSERNPMWALLNAVMRKYSPQVAHPAAAVSNEMDESGMRCCHTEQASQVEKVCRVS